MKKSDDLPMDIKLSARAKKCKMGGGTVEPYRGASFTSRNPVKFKPDFHFRRRTLIMQPESYTVAVDPPTEAAKERHDAITALLSDIAALTRESGETVYDTWCALLGCAPQHSPLVHAQALKGFAEKYGRLPTLKESPNGPTA